MTYYVRDRITNKWLSNSITLELSSNKFMARPFLTYESAYSFVASYPNKCFSIEESRV